MLDTVIEIREYLSKKDAVVAYNPENVDAVYLFQNGKYIEFQLIESRFTGKSFDEAGAMLKAQKEIVKNADYENLQGRIDLTSKLETIIKNTAKNDNINLKNVREYKDREKRKQHKDFIKEIANG